MNRRVRTVLGLCGAAVVCAASCSAAVAVPLPSADPFYSVPPSISGLANGTILASRSVAVSAYSIPMPVHAWQVKYKTTDNQGDASADVATVMVPDAPWTGSGPRPLVSYQTAEDGISTACAPSYGLRAGVTDDENNSGAETGLMEYALLQGWAVVAPDYEGPDSEFLAPAGEAHGVLDGMRAALGFAPAGLSARTPLAMWGYSGGSLATDLAAQAQPTYASSLHFKGIALGGTVADIQATLDAFSGGPAGGAIVMGFAAVNRDFPSANLLQYFNAAGRKAIAAAQNDCLVQAAAQFPFASLQQYEAYPGVESTPAVVNLLHSISPLGIPGTPTAPIYDYHSAVDELAPIGPDRRLMRRFCAAGVKVDHVETLLGEHVAVALDGAPGAVAYLAARFAGRPAPDDCAAIPG